VGSSASHIKYGVFEHAYQLLKYSGLNFSDSINISNNRIEDCTFGINIANCQNFTFNIFGNIFKNGYYFLSNLYDVNTNINILIESNFIETYSGSGSQTIHIDYAKDVILRNNIGIVKNDFLEVRFNSGYTELSGNTVTGAEKFAFMTGRDFLVANNNFTGFYGISVQNSEQVEIFNNNLRLFYKGSDTSSIKVSNQNGYGIFLGNNTHCNVRGNEIVGYGYDSEGIYLGYVDSASFTDNIVKGFKTGIMLNSTTGSICTLQNNTIFLNYNKGIHIKNNVSLTANYNNIYSNYDTLTYAPGSSTYYQSYDFYVESEIYNEIDARFNFWGDYLTQEIESGSNPKNITRIWDQYDNNALSFVNYGQWLSNVTIKNNYNISDTTLISGESYCFNATDQIIVAGDGNSVIIENGANANFVAGESVCFLPGFHAVAGSYTNAFITTTGIFCEPQYSGIELVSPDFKSLELEENIESFKGIENEKSVKIYPNPNNGHFTLELNNFDKPVDLYIMNMQGKVIYFSKEIEQSISSFDLSLHQNGIYFIRITKGIETYVRKIIKL
jgi:hypothetical protein